MGIPPSLYSRKKQKMVSGHHEKSNVFGLWKSLIRHPTWILKTLDFKSGPEKITTAIEAGTAPDVPLMHLDGSFSMVKMENWLIWTISLPKILSKMSIMKISSSQQGRRHSYMYPISSAPFYMAMNKKMLKDAGVLDLVKEGWTTDDLKSLESLERQRLYTSITLQ